MIHTARRNHLIGEKVQKIALVRKKVRDKDEKETNAASEGSFVARIVDSTERPKKDSSHKNCDQSKTTDVQPVTEEVEIQGNEDIQGDAEKNAQSSCDDNSPESNPVAYWQSVLGEKDDHTVLSDEWEDVVEEFGFVHSQSPHALKQINAPDRRPFPDFNQATFPQEKTLKGIRSWKVPLMKLFKQT